MKRYFTPEGPEVLAYDDDTEDWTINGAIEGNMARGLASMIMWGLRRDELQEDDALALLAPGPATKEKP